MRKYRLLVGAAVTSFSLLSFAGVSFSGNSDDDDDDAQAHAPASLKEMAQDKLNEHEEMQRDSTSGALKARLYTFKKKKQGKYLTNKWEGEKRRKQRIQLLEQKIGPDYVPSRDILDCASSLIEKKYAGAASVLDGLAVLQELQKTYLSKPANSTDLLAKQREACHRTLSSYKAQKKKKDIQRVKQLSVEDVQSLGRTIDETFPGQARLQAQLKDALNSELDCHNPKGFSIAVVPGVGGYGGMFRQSCKTPMGRRYYFYTVKGGVAVGAGGQLNQSGTGTNYTKHQKRTDDSTTKKVQLNAVAGAAAGIGADTDFDVPVAGTIRKSVAREGDQNQSSAKAQNRTSFGSIGLGIFAGLGPSFEYKEHRPSDFGSLFDNLGLIKKELNTKPLE